MIKNSVAVVIYSPDRSAFLVVQRPGDDADLPNAWGLPAASLKDGETFEDAVWRAGKEKLGVELKVEKLIQEGQLDRSTYTLFMKEFEASLVKGNPIVPQLIKGVTQYQHLQWARDPSILKEAAKKGSLCSRLYLKSLGLDWNQ